MKPKILLVCDEKGWGGWQRGEKVVEYLSDEFEFTLLDGHEFNRWEKYRKDKLRKFDLIYLLFHIMLMKKSVDRLLNQKFPFVSMITVYPVLRPAFKRIGKNPRANFLRQAKRSKAIFSNNMKSLNDLRRIYNGPSFYVPRGVDPEMFYPTSEFRQGTELTVAFCGKKNPEKGLNSIIRPACEAAEVNLITNQRNFTDALPQEQMREFYNSADIYIVASTMDGTPNTALEAAACGRPILSNSIGNMPEFIEDGVNGFLVDRKITSYVNRLKWFKRNRRKTWEMGQKARETVLNGWTWKHSMEYERKALRSVLNGR